MYKIETQNGVVLESPSIRNIMDELATMEHDHAVKFYYTRDEQTHESNSATEFLVKVGELLAQEQGTAK